MTKRITIEMLEGACEGQRDAFAKRYPKGITLKSEQDAIRAAVKVSGVFDWTWAADYLLSFGAREDYRRAKTAALKDFRRVRTAAWKDYNSAKSTAWENFWRVRTAAWGDLERAVAAAWKDYDRIIAAASKDLERAKATAFAVAFWNDT